jgi:hypothetical protein
LTLVAATGVRLTIISIGLRLRLSIASLNSLSV